MIASGTVFGPNQQVEINMLDLDLEGPLKGLKGLECELQDCVYPLVSKVNIFTDAKRAFEGIDYGIFCGAAPRKAGMERKDLLQKNAQIFKDQGAALKSVANKNAKLLVVGNPANTNALILKEFSGLNPRNITALTRLDENRARNMIARKAGAHVNDVKGVYIWGNHSATQYPDVNHGTVKGKPIRQVVNDEAYLNGQFIKDVQQRGAHVIQVRGGSSATSAARAAGDHVREWFLGTPKGENVSMAVWSNGNPYGIKDGLIYSFPVTCDKGDWKIVPGLPIDEFSKKLMAATEKELLEEKAQALS
jgi:malate dehydrogenase